MNSFLSSFIPQNADQVSNLVTKAMTFVGAALVAHGYTIADGSTWQQITGAVVAIAAYLYSHHNNKTP